MTNHSTSYTIKAPKEMAALAAASRQEVIDVLAEIGDASVADVAALLGRPPDALYFHFRALQRAGLVVQTGVRSKGTRKEALYRTIAPDLRLHYDAEDKANRQGVNAIVSSMLRLGIRDFQRAFERQDVLVSGPNRELWALRKTARLSLSDIAKLNRSIEELKSQVSKPSREGRLYGITILVTPLDHRQRESKKASRKRGRKK